MYKQFVIFLLLIMVSCTTNVKTDNIPIVKNGVLNVSDWDFNNPTALSLKGDWEIYWQKLYTPQDFQNKNIQPNYYLQVPGYWNGKMLDTIKLKGQSYATYRLKIISKTKHNLGIFLDEQMTAFKFWCNDSLIYECGKVADNPEDAVAQKHPIIKDITLSDTTEFIFQISNYNHRNGGFYTAPRIGSIKTIRNNRLDRIAIDIFMIGSLLVLGMYHIILSIYRKGMYEVLIFGLFAFFLAFRTLLVSSRFFSILFPDVSWNTQIRIEYLLTYLSSALMIAYIYTLYRKDFNRKVIAYFIVFNILLCFSIVLPTITFTSMLIVFHIFLGLVAIPYIVYRTIIIVKRKRNGSVIFVLSIIAFSFTALADILLVRNSDAADETDLIPLGTFIFILGQSLVFAQIIVKYFETNRNLKEKLNKKNKELEQVVKKQSKELKQQHLHILRKNKKVANQNNEIEYKNSELVKKTELLTKNEAKVRSIVELLPESIFEIDWQGDILLTNNEFLQNTGYDKNDKINISDIFEKHADCNLFFDCMTEHMKDGNIVKELRIDMKRKDKTSFPALLSASKIDNDKAIAYRCTFTEITHRIADQETIRNAYEVIKNKNKNIADSLHYASTIQKAFMPSNQAMYDSFKNYFVINKPHSIVSGDFYFLKKKGKHIVFALSDCTGHGVPGGFMTMLGITLLNQIYAENKIVSPDIALNIMRKNIITSLHQTDKNEVLSNQDGMDMILCVFDTETLLLKFASAKQTLLLSRNCNITKFNGDRMPVGIYSDMKDFSLQEIQLQKDDTLYFFTDGVIDIFGGDKGKRLSSKGLNKILNVCCDKELNIQQNIINDELQNWQGDQQQVDDMLMVGIKI